MPQCAVSSCRNSHRRTRGHSIRYHRFPQLSEVRNLWVKACNRTPLANGEPPFNIKTARVCSLHFTQDSYERDVEQHDGTGFSTGSRLRRGAVPTLMLSSNAAQPTGAMHVDRPRRNAIKVERGKNLDNRETAGNYGGSNNGGDRVVACATKRQPSEKKQQQEKQEPPKRHVTNHGQAAPVKQIQEQIEKIRWMRAALDLKSCLNKMHAMESAGGNGRNVDAAERTPREDESSRTSPNVPQSQQNGAALPEETATSPTAMDGVRPTALEKESSRRDDTETDAKSSSFAGTSQQQQQQKSVTTATARNGKAAESAGSEVAGKKRKSIDGSSQASTNGPSTSKKLCLEQREQYIATLTTCDKNTAEEIVAKANQLRAEIQALDKLALAKEMEWNDILRMRKLKEEAYLRIERKRHVISYMKSSSDLPETLPPASLSLSPKWDSINYDTLLKEKSSEFKEDLSEESSQDAAAKKHKVQTKVTSQRRAKSPPKSSGGSSRKQNEASNPEYRQIGEGRQGAILDVTSIIAKHREEHPESVPRRGRRMRNSVNVGLTTGGAMVETGHSADSRPSSTDSCKSNPNTIDCNNSMSFKDVLVQFAKLSRQQGEPIQTPQNYPDVTLHPVPPSPVQNTAPQQSGSLLHGILTKAQSPRPTTFSPTLARLLTAPEKERNSPAAAATAVSMPQQSAATQHLLQAYQGSNLGTISELLSSSKARTEITITPVVNTQSHSNMIHVEDVEEETAVIDDRDGKYSAGGRDGREERDNPPRCQGCHERAAQFVCAGCGNQWYCSRECQVSAWDEHSEVCSG